MVTVYKAYVEVEDPAWCLYDEAYSEKVAAIGCREWNSLVSGGVCGPVPEASDNEVKGQHDRGKEHPSGDRGQETKE